MEGRGGGGGIRCGDWNGKGEGIGWGGRRGYNNLAGYIHHYYVPTMACLLHCVLCVL